MRNHDIAMVLFNISSILRQQHGNPYRIRAYQRAAQSILRMREPIHTRIRAGKPLDIPQLGKSLTAKITALALDGRLPFYDQLCAELPAEQQLLLRVPGLGPTIAARIHRDLGAISAQSLSQAAATGALQRVWGVGPKRTAAILDTIAAPTLRQEQIPL